jgi:hypothetical protein
MVSSTECVMRAMVAPFLELDPELEVAAVLA